MDDQYTEQWIRQAMHMGRMGSSEEYLSGVRARLHKGAREYPGELSAENRGLLVVIAKAQEEGLDVTGWASLGAQILHADMVAGRRPEKQIEAGQEWLLEGAMHGALSWHAFGMAEQILRPQGPPPVRSHRADRT